MDFSDGRTRQSQFLTDTMFMTPMRVWCNEPWHERSHLCTLQLTSNGNETEKQIWTWSNKQNKAASKLDRQYLTYLRAILSGRAPTLHTTVQTNTASPPCQWEADSLLELWGGGTAENNQIILLCLINTVLLKGFFSTVRCATCSFFVFKIRNTKAKM